MRRLEEEDGASLMLVILFVTVFAVVIGAILDFASTGFRTTTAIASVRDEQHGADGAMDGAINAIRGSSKGLGNNDCVSPADDFIYDDPVVGTITVKCDGIGGSTGTTTSNIPEYAILTLGTDASEGFIKSGNNELVVDGGIYSNSKVNVTKDRITVFGDAYARLGCPPESGGQPTKLFATGERDCHVAAVHPDPNYAPAVTDTSGMAVDPLATCASNNSVVKFSPGLYTRLPSFHVPTNCKGSTWWFSPGSGSLGVYYFDFPDAESLWDTHVDQVQIVGGTLKSPWSDTTLGSAITMPGACDPGTELTPNPGVQFIFGGQSRLSQQVHDEGIELCTWGPATGQRIVFFGLRPSDGTRSSFTNEVKQAATASATNFANPDNALALGGGSAVASLAGDGAKTASLTLSDFADIPDGSRIDAATIEITHQEGGTNPLDADLTWVWKPKTGTDVTCSTTANVVSHTDVCDILPTLDASNFPHSDFNGLKSSTLDVDASSLITVPGEDCLKPNGNPKPNCTPTPPIAETATVSVDAIVLKVTYTSPGFEAHRCATTTTPPSCSILETKTNPTAYFQGTFYAPTAKVSVNIHNNGETVFARGIIARMIDGDASASSKQTSAPFQLPGTSGTRVVLFTAYIDGKPRLRAKVTYDDTGALPGRSVTINDWAVIR